MNGPFALALFFAACLLVSSPTAQGGEPQKKPRGKSNFVGLCARTARDGYVILEARVMQSSGDPKVDAQAVQDVLGHSVPMPNMRMWFEWLSTGVGYDPDYDGEPDKPFSFDCSALDREAKAKAGLGKGS